MALRSGGAEVSQETIVAAIKGRLTVQGASNAEITSALNAIGFNRDGTIWAARAISQPGAPVPGGLVEQLQNDKPVIVEYPTGPLSGHVVVIHEATYQQTWMGTTILSITIFDPYTGKDFAVAGQFVPLQTMNTWYVSVQRASAGEEESPKSTSKGAGASKGWDDVGADSPDIEIHTSPDWGDQRSGLVTARVRVNNTSDEDTYRVEVKVAVVRKDRGTKEATGEVDSGTKQVIVPPNTRKTLTFNLRWATATWQPNWQEMPAIASPGKDTEYANLRIWRKSKSQKPSDDN
jgi:hypothetical protein